MSLFITFEGGEGSGKSTQSRALHRRLCDMGVPALLTHEPGGTSLGREVRRWVKKQGEEIDPIAELLLFNASRAQLVSNVVWPALKGGKVVICDRFHHSTLAYQGHGRGLSLDLISSTNDVATGGLEPDLTIFLDIGVERGLRRKNLKDRFEQEGIAFHQRVREGYLEMARSDPQRWLVIDGSLPKKEIEGKIWEWLNPLLPQPQRAKKG